MLERLADYPATKCGSCHLFVERQSDYDIEAGFAEYIHLHRGDEEDEALDETHEACVGETRMLSWWKVNGPSEMVARFTVEQPRED